MKLEDFELLCVLLNFCVLLVLMEMQTEEEKKSAQSLDQRQNENLELVLPFA